MDKKEGILWTIFKETFVLTNVSNKSVLNYLTQYLLQLCKMYLIHLQHLIRNKLVRHNEDTHDCIRKLQRFHVSENKFK